MGAFISEVGMANRTMPVTLGDHFSAFVEEQVAEGRYASASDVVHAGLRLLEDHEARLAALRVALAEGEASGVATPFDFDAFIARKRRAGSPAS